MGMMVRKIIRGRGITWVRIMVRGRRHFVLRCRCRMLWLPGFFRLVVRQSVGARRLFDLFSTTLWLERILLLRLIFLRCLYRSGIPFLGDFWFFLVAVRVGVRHDVCLENSLIVGGVLFLKPFVSAAFRNVNTAHSLCKADNEAVNTILN
jgi:hypothetical protein